MILGDSITFLYPCLRGRELVSCQPQNLQSLPQVRAMPAHCSQGPTQTHMAKPKT